jgi:hypothetical protein
MKKIRIASMDELGDLIAWMHSHICEDDWPLMTEDAVQWLCTLGVGEHEVPDKYVVPIEYGIEDWLEVLSNYEDSEPFDTELIVE